MELPWAFGGCTAVVVDDDFDEVVADNTQMEAGNYHSMPLLAAARRLELQPLHKEAPGQSGERNSAGDFVRELVGLDIVKMAAQQASEQKG